MQAVLAEYQEKLAFYFDEVTRFASPFRQGAYISPYLPISPYISLYLTRFASPFRQGALSLEAWVEVC